MWFNRMALEDWFDTYQYATEYDIGESAVKYMTAGDLDMDLSAVPLRYGHHRGLPGLRARIAEGYEGLSPEHVLVTSGASEANFAVVAALVKPGDHVVVEHPNYPSLYEVPRSLGCRVSLLELRFEDRFRPDLDELERMLTPETKLVSLTHPNNPTGSTISLDELERVIRLVESRRIHLLFDETYREMDYTGKLPPAASLSPSVISISSMSKCYGLPGIRIGWVATQDTQLLDTILAIREQLSICNNALSETIAEYALERGPALLGQAKSHILRNLDIVASWMKTQQWLEWVPPQAGVVCFPRLGSHLKTDPESFYRRLAHDCKTFVIPGRCFEMDNRHFRLGFGGQPEEIRTGLDNVARLLSEEVA